MFSWSLINIGGANRLYFYCESGFNEYAGQKTLMDIFGASLFCSVQLIKEKHIFNYRIKGAAANCFLFPEPVIDNLTQRRQRLFDEI